MVLAQATPLIITQITDSPGFSNGPFHDIIHPYRASRYLSKYIARKGYFYTPQF